MPIGCPGPPQLLQLLQPHWPAVYVAEAEAKEKLEVVRIPLIFFIKLYILFHLFHMSYLLNSP